MFFFKKEPEEYYGANIDTRLQEEVVQDFQADEILPRTSAVQYIDDFSKFPFYELRDQKRGNTCVAQAYAQARAIMAAQKTGEYLPLSSAYLYKRRANAPQEGMAMHDVLAIGAKEGTPPEALHPYQGATDEQIAGLREHVALDDYAKVVAGKDQYIYLQNNFERIAEQVQHRPVILFIYATAEEWKRIRPEVRDRTLTRWGAPIRHGIVGLAPVRYKYEDYILVADSWGILGSKVENDEEDILRHQGQRLLSREFVNNRVYSAATFIPAFNFVAQEVSIAHRFDFDLEYGDQSAEVKALQLVLQELGHFPHGQECTGNYYGITLRAVQSFQKEHGIASKGYTIDGYGRVGAKTRQKLNELADK